MDLVNRKVKSKVLGIGTVVEQDDSHVIVQFAVKKSTFEYPEAFRKFLTAEDVEIQQALLAEIAVEDSLIEEAKIKVEEARKVAEQSKLEELAAKAGCKTASKPVRRIERVEGQQLTFIVFQGSTFAKGCKGGYIWAPKYTLWPEALVIIGIDC